MADKSKIEYRLIPNRRGYRVGNDGSVWSRIQRIGQGRGKPPLVALADSWKPLKIYVDRYGRCAVQLGRGYRRYVHQLVLEGFVGPRPTGTECCHKDNNPQNNHLNNLRWDTSKANTDDQRKSGRLIGGERHGNSKLSNSQADQIRALGRTVKQKEIARMFKVAQSTVSVILNNKSRTESAHAGRGLYGQNQD